MNRSTMTSGQIAAYNAMRSMACIMSIADLRKEIEVAQETGDEFRAKCFQALLAEAIAENA